MISLSRTGSNPVGGIGQKIIKMEGEFFRYEFIRNGKVIDRITCSSREELKRCIDILKDWEEKNKK